MFFIFIFGIFFLSPIQGGPVVKQNSHFLLPNNVISTENLKYNINLNLANGFNKALAYDGKTTITFTAASDASSFKFHYTYDLKQNNVNLKEVDKKLSIKLTQLKDVEMYEVALVNGKLKKDQTYNLQISFDGKLDNKSMYGFYLSTYDSDKYLATTQFEPTYARRAFPCFDEPKYKAVFKVTIEHPNDFTALFNTAKIPLESTVTKTTFKETEKISTYLIAFVVSQFSQTKINENYSVWARNSQSNFTEYAKTKTLNVVNFFTNNLGKWPLDAPMNKVDQVAIPDFAAGAMENWGLITYREQALLFDPKNANERNRQSILTVIAHELAHFWFGNLVTLNWWSNTWLNEGFARFFEYHAAHEVEPTWELDKQFVIEQQQTVFRDDSVDHVLPLSSDVYIPSEISNKFGTITYNKGASVIRMMAKFLGNQFYAALKYYMTSRKHTNTDPDKLFTDIQKVTGTDNLPPYYTLGQVMHNWFFKAGFPILTVKRVNNTLNIEQKRFRADPPSMQVIELEPTTWIVPVTYKTEKSKEDKLFWLTQKEDIIKDENIANSKWILVNLDSNGYYRVNYEEDMWNAIAEQLSKPNFGQINDLQRSQLVDDVMNLARAREQKYSVALNIIQYLKNETSYYPWYSALKSFEFLQNRLDGQLLNKINDNITELIDSWYFSIDGKQPKEHLETLTHILAHEWACKLRIEKCITKAKQLFIDEYVKPDYRSFVYCTAVREDDTNKNFEKLMNKLKAGNIPSSEQLLIISALGCSRNEKKLKEYLKMSIDNNSVIRRQDANYVFNSVLLGNPIGVDICLDFIKENPILIAEHYGGMNAVSSIATNIARRLKTTKQVDKLHVFLVKEKIVDAEVIINYAHANLNWAKEFQLDFEKYFNINSKPSKNSSNNVYFNTILLWAAYLAYYFNN